MIGSTGEYSSRTFTYDPHNSGDLIFSTSNLNAAEDVFTTAVGDGTKEKSPTYVEWSLSTLSKDGSGDMHAVGTTKQPLNEGAGARYISKMEDKGYFLKEHTHNHTGNIAYPSGLNTTKLSGDLLFAQNRINYNLSKGKDAPIFYLYINNGKNVYTPQSKSSDFKGGYPYKK